LRERRFHGLDAFLLLGFVPFLLPSELVVLYLTSVRSIVLRVTVQVVKA